jgi:hypothetical protein
VGVRQHLGAGERSPLAVERNVGLVSRAVLGETSQLDMLTAIPRDKRDPAPLMLPQDYSGGASFA